MATRQLPDAELLRKLLRYDPETGKLYWLSRTPDMFIGGNADAKARCKAWNTRYAGREAFTSRNNFGYPHGTVLDQSLVAHRVIWVIMTGRWPASMIDHINGKPDDNRFVNLREATGSQNQHNRGLAKNNTSGFKGVTWRKAEGKWRARIVVMRKEKSLGMFDTAEEAYAAFCAACEKYHGTYGRTK